jgi:hypothetical protein
MSNTPIRCSPDDPNPTHHIRLVGGGIDIGLVVVDSRGIPDPYAITRDRLQNTSLKINEGNPKYSDFELPFTPLSQEDFSGGRGQERYEDDVTRFLDSWNIQTGFEGKVFLSGQAQLTKGNRNMDYVMPGSVHWQSMLPGSRRYLARKFTASASYTATKSYILVKRKGMPTEALTVQWRSDNAGDPGAVLKTVTLAAANVPDVLGIWQKFQPSSAQSLTGATAYWIEVYGGANANTTDHWKVAVDDNPSASATKESVNESTWITSGVDLYFQIMDADNTPDRVWQFRCKGASYTLFDWDGADPKLYLSGDRGTADANTGNLGRLNDGSKSWTANQWTGCIAYLTGGKGSTEEQPWRLIASNDTGYLNVSPNWKIEHDTTTEYAILGSGTWQEIGSVLPTGDITDICIHDGVIYIARGDAATIRRIEFYTNAGTWSSRTYDDGAYKADLLCVVYHSDDVIKKIQMWRLIQDTQQISRGDIPAWGANFTFGTGIQVGDKVDKARKLVQYIDPTYGCKVLWVIKKGSVWAVKSDVPDMIQLPEMQTVASENTGRAVMVHNLFMYWTMFQGGIERFYQDVVDDIGPNKDRGFEVTRRGTVWDMEGYPGRFFAAINGGTDKYSCIVMYNGNGYHETYRSDEIGQQIKSLHIEVIPGGEPNRMWFTENNTIKWLPLPSESIDPLDDPEFPYTHEGHVISSRMHAGMMDINKLYDSLKIMADKLEEGVCWIEVDYKVDDEDAAWMPFPVPFARSPSEELNFVSTGEDGITGKYLLIRLRFNTSDVNKTPEMRASLVNSLSKVPTKFGFVVQVLLASRSKDLRGEPDDYYEDGLKKLDDLDELAESLNALEMSCILRPFHNKRVTIDAPALRPLYDSPQADLEGFIGTLPITVVYRAETTA